MNQFSTLKRIVYSTLFIVILFVNNKKAIGQCITTTNCTSVTEPFDNDNSIASTGFSTNDYTFNTSSSNKFLESSNVNSNNQNAASNTKTLLTNTYKANASGSNIALTFSLGRLLSNQNGSLNVRSYTINAVTGNNSGPRTQLCTGNTITLSSLATVICFNIATPAALANKFLKFEIILVLQSSANQNHLTFDNFGTNLSPSESALPVNFVSFEGKKVANGTQLTWKVGGEVNVKEYEVERSTTGNSGFAKIGSVPATGSDTYTFTDAASHSSAVFYRIKNVDNDGKFKYSTILSFRNGAGSVVFKVAPTVVNNKTVVQHNAATVTTQITLSTADGRVVRSIRPTAGSMQTDVDMSSLSAGLYLLKYSDGTTTSQTVKLVKQ